MNEQPHPVSKSVRDQFEAPQDFGRWSKLGTPDGESVMFNSSHSYPRTINDYVDEVRNLVEGNTVTPVWMEMRPTDVCNQDCTFCGTREGRETKHAQMELIRALELIHEAKEAGIKEIRFCGGGEPLAYRGIEQLVQTTHRLGLGVMFITNGLLLNEQRCAAIAPYCRYIRMSVNGGQSSYHLIHRTPLNSFSKVMTNMRNLGHFRAKHGLEHQLYVATTYVVMPENYQDIYDTAVKAKDNRVDAIYFRGATILPEFSPEQRIAIKEEAARCEALKDDNFVIHFAARIFDPEANPPINHGYCYQSQLRLYIEADGNASICAKFAPTLDYSLGNINQHSLKQILEGAMRSQCRRTPEMSCTGCDSAYFNQAMGFIERKLRAGESRFLRVFDSPTDRAHGGHCYQKPSAV